MDVGFYLGELLMQQGEVSVPGLGYFVQARVSGYYDENERRFYPPYHQAQFDLQSIEDDALAEYIAVKKNISVASARYFAEKYIINLKQQALITEVPIGNLGWFYTELAQLTFRPATKIPDDTIFYGFEPISITKASHIQAFEERNRTEPNFANKTVPPKPAIVEEVNSTFVQVPPVAEEPVNLPSYETEPQNDLAAGDFFDSEEEQEEEASSFSGPLRVVAFVLIGIIIIAVGIFALHQYQPDTFAKIAFWKKTEQPVIVPIKPAAVKPADTLASDTLKVDTNAVANVPVPVVDTIELPVKKSKVISETVTGQSNSAPKSRILSVTPVTDKSVTKKEIVISKTPVNPTVVPLPNTPKKKETVITKPVVTYTTPAAGTPVVTKPITEKAKPASAETTVNSSALQAQPSEAVGTLRYEVYATKGSTTIAEANVLIKKLKKAGLSPRVITDAPGTLIHISIGHFSNKQDAMDLAMKEIEAGHIPGGDAYALQVFPKN